VELFLLQVVSIGSGRGMDNFVGVWLSTSSLGMALIPILASHAQIDEGVVEEVVLPKERC
jgi:hypothetical protein